jgi:hypothetical protein
LKSRKPEFQIYLSEFVKTTSAKGVPISANLFSCRFYWGCEKNGTRLAEGFSTK